MRVIFLVWLPFLLGCAASRLSRCEGVEGETCQEDEVEWWQELPPEGPGFGIWDTLLFPHLEGESAALSGATIEVVSSNQPYFDDNPTRIARDLTQPLLCDFVLLTSHNLTQQDYDCRPVVQIPAPGTAHPRAQRIAEPTSLYDGIRRTYAQWQSGICLLNIRNPLATELPSNAKFNAEKAMRYRFYERYRAALIYSTLAMEGKIKDSSGGRPPAVFMDRATIPTNKWISWRELEARLDRGFRASAMKESGEGGELSVRNVAFAGIMSSDCREENWLNAGAFYFRPSRTANAIFSTVLNLIDSQGDHPFGSTHEGSLTHALGLLFGTEETLDESLSALNADLEGICSNATGWSVSVDEKSPAHTHPIHLLERVVRPELVNQNKELGAGARVSFGPEVRLSDLKILTRTRQEPLYAVIMPPRWLAGAACPWDLLESKASNVWHPHDFGAQFRGCETVGHFTGTWRTLVKRVGKYSLPWIDEDEDWDLWASQGVSFWIEDESKRRSNYLLSPECPSVRRLKD